MGDVGSLGQYKVVVTADYSQLQSQFKAMSDYIADMTKSITSNLNTSMISGFTDMGKGVNKVMESSLNDTVKTTERKLNELKKKYEDFYKGLPKPEPLAMPSAPSPSSRGGSSSRSASTGFRDYASRVRAEAKAAEDFYKEQGKAILAAEERAIAGRTAAHKAFWQEQARLEGENRKRIATLGTQYKVAYEEANKYLQSHAKMSEAVFLRLQGRLTAISREMRDLGSSPAKLNPLEGLKYSDYESKFSKLNDLFASLKHHLTWMASAAAIGITFGIPAKTVSTIAEVEKQMAQMKQVNHEVHSDQVVYNQTMQEFIGIAEKYGHSVDDIIKAGVLWGRAYKDLNTVMKLTNLSAKLAVADNMNVDLANRAVESVINGYQKQGQAVQFASHVVDSWTKIAHNAQSSATDLAEALMRTGAAAKAVGVDFDTTNALASTMIKATGRSGAEIGNALKSLFSSIHSDKAIKQLEALGIEMYKVDEQGQKHFRNLHDVFVDLMITSHTTSRNMEKDLLAISGGKFQWSKVASVLGSYQDFIKSYHLSISAAGFSNEQIEAQLNTINRRFEQLKATVTGIATGMGASGLSAYIKNILVSLNSFAQALQRIPTSTYEMIGAIVKWGAALGGALFILRRVVAGIVGMQAAYRTFAAAQALETVATEASTGAKIRNTLARVAGVNAARSQFAASTMATGGIIAETAATEAATVATTGWATAMTAATAGLNLVLAAIAAATVAFLGYNTTVSDSIEKQEGLKQSSEDLIAIEQQKLDMTKKEADFVETLIRAHFKLAEQVDNTSNSEEKNAQIKRDLQATDQKLAEIIGEDGLKRIKSSKDVQTAVDTEKAKYKAKAESCVKNMIESAKAEREYTRQALQAAVDRVDALKSETQAWGAWARAKQAAMNVYAGLAEGQMKSATYQMSIHEAGSPEYDRAAQQLKVWQNERDWASNWKPGEVTGELAQLEQTIAELNGKLAKQDLNISGMELNLAQIQRNGLNGLPTDETDSGEVAEEAGKVGTDKKGRAPSERAGAKEADNSIEAMLYRHMTKALKLTHAQAVAELANIQQESGFNYQADNGTHKGLYQFDSNRWAEYQSWLANTGRTDSAVSQVDYRNLYESKYVPYEAQMQQAYLQSGATTPEEYAAAFNQYIERSGEVAGDVGYENRMRNARQLDARFSKRNGEENFDDVLSARENAYKQLYDQFNKEIKDLETERATIGQGISAEEKKKIFEKIMGVGEGKSNVIFAEVEKAQEDYAKILLNVAKEEAKRAQAAEKAAETQMNAIEKMADSEVAFAEKLGLLNSADVREYNYRKNEENYAKNKPILDAKLGATVDMSKGTADDMLEAYQRLIYAQNDLEAKHYAEKVMWLSRDVDATQKALDEELKLEEKYQTERTKLQQEAFQEKNRYALGFIDSFSNAVGSGLESILNRTKSFADAFRDIFKSIVNDIIKMFSEDFAKRIKKWLSNAIFKKTETGNKAGSFLDPDNIFGGGKKTGSKSVGGGGGFDIVGWAQSSLSSLGGGMGKGKGKGNGNVLVNALGLNNFASTVKSAVQPGLLMLRNQAQLTVQGISNVSQQGMQMMYTGLQTGTQMMGVTYQGYKVTQVATEQMGNSAIVASSQSTAATVQATTAQMMGWIMAVLALFSLFGGGGGSSTETSTSSVNLGRSPDSYYMTPTPVMQSTTFNVPSFDIGGNIERDMFAMVHKGEMVLTPEQADVIRNTARTNSNGSMGGGANANIKSNVTVSTVDSRGFERVLNDYNRQLSKNVKKGIRNGYLTAKGLM